MPVVVAHKTKLTSSVNINALHVGCLPIPLLIRIIMNSMTTNKNNNVIANETRTSFGTLYVYVCVLLLNCRFVPHFLRLCRRICAKFGASRWPKTQRNAEKLQLPFVYSWQLNVCVKLFVHDVTHYDCVLNILGGLKIMYRV